MSGGPRRLVSRPCGPLVGEVRAVSDKSLSHRALIFASLSRGRSRIREANRGEDCRSTAGALAALGAGVEPTEDGWEIEGTRGRFRDPEEILDLGNSGTGIRLLAGCIAGRRTCAVLTGDCSLRRRPMRRVAEPLERMGASIHLRDGEYPPMAIRGAIPRPLRYEAPIASAQVKSAILLAATGLEGGIVEVREPACSRDHTERFMEWLGLPIVREAASCLVRAPIPGIDRFEISIPADPSSAAFYIVAATLVPGSDLLLGSVLLNPTRSGFLDALAAMGASIEVEEEDGSGPERIARIRARYAPLRGTEISGELLLRSIDEIPILTVAAVAAQGVTEIRDARELRVKESDRLASSAAMARALGAEVALADDRLTIHGRGAIEAGAIEVRGDHRIAMSGIVAGCAARGEVAIDDASPIPTSDPGFVAGIVRLGANLE